MAVQRARQWMGVGIAVGAGVGMALGLAVVGRAGIAIGVAFGAGLGVVAGSAWDARRTAAGTTPPSSDEEGEATGDRLDAPLGTMIELP